MWSSICFFIIGVAFGGYLYKRLMKKAFKIETKKALDNKKNQYLEILTRLKSGDSDFVSRLNDTVYISSNLSSVGLVEVVYLIDKNDVVIFQGPQCISTSDGIEKEIINEIIITIKRKYKKKIEDIVNIFGLIFWREDFEKSIGIKAEELKKLSFLSGEKSEKTEVEIIELENLKKFDIDEILDKISAFGIGILTPDEKDFLDKYSNEKRD
jgi:hypothetical protein